MATPRSLIAQRTVALLGAAFGVLTLVASARVLGGADPGYVVYRPLVAFNAAMGLAYLVAAGLAWRDVRRGFIAALAIALLNAAALGWIAWLRARDPAAVAAASLGAMSLRTGFWAAAAALLAALRRRRG